MRSLSSAVHWVSLGLAVLTLVVSGRESAALEEVGHILAPTRNVKPGVGDPPFVMQIQSSRNGRFTALMNRAAYCSRSGRTLDAPEDYVRALHTYAFSDEAAMRLRRVLLKSGVEEEELESVIRRRLQADASQAGTCGWSDARREDRNEPA